MVRISCDSEPPRFRLRRVGKQGGSPWRLLHADTIVAVTTTHLLAGGQNEFWHGLASWEGWNMTGALAGVAAALVIIPAVIRYFRQRHRPYVGYLELNVFGTKTIGAKKVHLAELSNGGGEAVSIHMIGFAHSSGAWHVVGEPPKWWLAVGESMTVPIDVVDEQQAWVLVMYVSMEDVRYARTTWMPLFRESDAYEAWVKSTDTYEPPRWWQPWKRTRKGKARPVGPGGAWIQKVRHDRSDDMQTVVETLIDVGGNVSRAGTAATPKAP